MNEPCISTTIPWADDELIWLGDRPYIYTTAPDGEISHVLLHGGKEVTIERLVKSLPSYAAMLLVRDGWPRKVRRV